MGLQISRVFQFGDFHIQSYIEAISSLLDGMLLAISKWSSKSDCHFKT